MLSKVVASNDKPGNVAEKAVGDFPVDCPVGHSMYGERQCESKG